MPRQGEPTLRVQAVLPESPGFRDPKVDDDYSAATKNGHEDQQRLASAALCLGTCRESD